MKGKNIEINNNSKSSKQLSILGRIKLKLREIKNDIKNDFEYIKETNKKDLFTQLLSTRYFLIALFVVILLKTILFSADTVFYNEGIWLWYIRQTSFFIILMVSPLLLFRSSRVRFIVGMILNFLISLLLFADEIYYLYASNIISVMQARQSSI